MISVVILTKNEEKNIERCLNSILWCDEIIVIDDHSIDKTVMLAKQKGAKVFTRSLNDDFASQRNFGLEKAKEEWVLFLDADEQISQPLWFELMEHTNNPQNTAVGFYIRRVDTIWGKQLHFGESGNHKILRLAKKDAGKWVGKVHEVWKVRGTTVVLQKQLDHFPHQTVSAFLAEINYYTDIRANELFQKKVPVIWWHLIVYPKAKFVINYFIKMGYRDGLPGFVSALMMSFHSFLVRGKLWLLWQKK